MKHKIFIADYLHFALCGARNTFTYKLKASDVKILSLPEERQFQAIFFRSMFASSPLTRVIYPSLLSKQPISVRCHPNGGFYLNKEKWPKSQRRHSNTGHCQISAHTPEMGSLQLLPNIQIWGQIFVKILSCESASLDLSDPLNDFLNWRKFSWLPHNGLDRVVRGCSPEGRWHGYPS